MISVILNGYKRAENLNEQLEALKNQSVQPDEILFWYNNPGDNDLINYDIGTEIAGAYCNYTLVYGHDLRSHLWLEIRMCVFLMTIQYLAVDG